MKPLLSIVMNHHENYSQKYLDLALQSIDNSEGINIECVLVLTTVNEPELPPYPWLKRLRLPRETTGPQASNIGHDHVRPESTLIMHANDDVIFSKYALREMADTCSSAPMLLNPLSNCENQWLYHTDIIKFQNGDKTFIPNRFVKREEVNGFEQAIMDYPLQARIIMATHQLCTFATMYQKEVWKRLGGYDTQFIMGWSDTDLSIRAKQQGIFLGTHLGAFIFHFGGVTTTQTSTNDVRAHDKIKFGQKHNVDPNSL